MWSRVLEIYGRGADKIGKIEVRPRQNTLLGGTAPPTSQFVQFFIMGMVLGKTKAILLFSFYILIGNV